jgi:peptidoglycan hydrolase CwlO-like protein/surface antigen
MPILLMVGWILVKRILHYIPRSKFSRIRLGVCATLVAIAAPLQLTGNAVHADQYDDQINAIQNEVDQYQSQANQYHKKANSLQAAVNALTAEKNAIQAQLDLSQAKFNKLTSDIAKNKEKLKDNQKALGDIIADLYVDGEVSPLEMLASSKNVGEYMDKNTYQSSVRDKLNSTINAIKDLKELLEHDQKEVKKVLDQQKAQQAALAAKEAQKQELLNQTRGSEAAYKQKVAQGQAQMAAVAAEQQAALARATGGGAYNYGTIGSFQFRNYSGNMGCTGGYSYCGAQDSYPDPWGLYNRECVSYTAWAAVTRFNKYVTNFAGAGNAYEWPSTTQSMGAYTDHNPSVGSVAILPPTPGFSPIGHAMLVESIQGGGWVHVSQYNFGGTGEYSAMDIQASGVVFVHFRDK